MNAEDKNSKAHAEQYIRSAIEAGDLANDSDYTEVISALRTAGYARHVWDAVARGMGLKP